MSSKALALSCLWGTYDFNVDYVEEVPPDVVIVASHTFSDTTLDGYAFRLLDAAENEVPITVEWFDHSLRITPDAELPPGDYQLIDDGLVDLGYTDLGRVFTVVDLADEDEPLEAPQVNARRRIERSRDWGDSKGVSVSFSDVPGASTYEIELSDTSDFVSASMVVSTDTQDYLGDTLCGPDLANYIHGQTNWVRVRAIGIDGRVSDWSTPVFAEASFLGCSVQPGGPLGGTALALAMGLGLMGLRRRR